MTRPTRGPRAAAVLTLTLVAAAAHAEDTATMLVRVSPAVVTILTENGQSHGRGRGFLIDPEGVIVTAYHVISGASRARAVLSSGAGFDVDDVLATDPT